MRLGIRASGPRTVVRAVAHANGRAVGASQQRADPHAHGAADGTTNFRITITNRNEPGTLSNILTLIGEGGINVVDLLNKFLNIL